MQIKSGLSLKVVALGILLIFFFVLSGAQETKSESSQAQETQELKHEVSVTLKLVQVFVMDKSGNPITDLGPEEFIIYDNKKLQKLTEFEKYTLSPKKEETITQSQKKAGESLTYLSESMNRKFFLLFDLAYNNPKGFQKAQEAALYFIDSQLHPADEVGVLSFSVMKGLTLHEYFTQDLGAVRNVIEQMRKEGLVGRAENFEALIWRELEGQSALDASQPSMPIKDMLPAHLGGKPRKQGIDDPAFQGSIEADHRFKRDQLKDITRNMLSRLTDLSKALRYIPGNKYIILFSSGIPYSLIYGIASSNAGLGGSYGMDRLLINKYEEMLKELSNANTAVFSLNTESMIEDINVPSHQKGEDTLRKISHDTGGKFLGNVQNYGEIIGTVQEFTGSYYVLGYYVNESYDGRYHSLKVEVSRPGSKVFAQRGYYNPKQYSKYTKTEKDLHLIDMALSERPLYQTPIPLPMTVIPCPLGGNPGVLMLSQILGAKISESIGHKAEIYFLVFDEKENPIFLKRKAVATNNLKTKDALYYSLANISPGKYLFRIVVRDLDTGRGAVGRFSLEIPEISKNGLQLFPPLLLSQGKSGAYIRGYVPKTHESSFPLLDLFPFDPEQYSPILEEVPKNTQKIQAILHCSMQNLTEPVLKFTAALIENSTGKSTSLPLTILSGKKGDGEGTLLIELKMPEMEPGEYILSISAVDLTSKSQSQTSMAYRIH